MKLLSLLSYSILSSSLLTLAACGDGGSDPAAFAKSTEIQKQRAVVAGAGLDAAVGYLFGSLLSSAPPEQACPKAVRSGDTVTVTTNCTTESGDKYSGTITAKNVAGFLGGEEADPTKPQIVTFDGFAIDATDDDEDVAIDGSVTLTTSGAMQAELDMTLTGILVHTEATWNNAAGLQSATDGSFIDVDGLGSADIKGSWNMSNDAPAGALELHGSDVLKANFGAMANDCVPLTVDGNAAGQLCNTADE